MEPGSGYTAFRPGAVKICAVVGAATQGAGRACQPGTAVEWYRHYHRRTVLATGDGRRAAAGIKTTPEGKSSYLESVYGKGSVVTRPDGEVAYLNPGTGRWTQFDEQGAGLGDIADFSGDAIEIAPTFLGPPDPLTVAARAVAGNAIRQAISGALPGEDYPQGGLSEAGGRLGNIARAGVFGGAGQKGANVTFGQLRGILADEAKRATLSPVTIAALENQVGMKLGEKITANLSPELLDWLIEGANPGWE